MKIGVPNRFVDEQILAYLREHGFKLAEKTARKYLIKCKKPRCTIYLLNPMILPELVEEGLLDLAIIQSVDFSETQTFAVPLLQLDTPHARLMLGVKKSIPLAPLQQLPIKTVLTRTPVLTKQFLEKNKLKWKTRTIRGPAESVASLFGKNFAVVEYVRSGKTMELNELVPVTEVASSVIVMITHPNKVHSPEIKKIRKLLVSPSGRQSPQPDESSEVIIYSKPVSSVSR